MVHTKALQIIKCRVIFLQLFEVKHLCNLSLEQITISGSTVPFPHCSPVTISKKSERWWAGGGSKAIVWCLRPCVCRAVTSCGAGGGYIPTTLQLPDWKTCNRSRHFRQVMEASHPSRPDTISQYWRVPYSTQSSLEST